MRAVVAHGTTVLLTTQYLDEADQLAGRIAVIDHGKVIAEGTPGELKASVGAGHRAPAAARPGQRDEAERVLGRALDAHRCSCDADPVGADRPGRRATAREQRRGRAGLARAGRTGPAGIVVDDFSLGQPSLDEVFLALTDRPDVDKKEVAA